MEHDFSSRDWEALSPTVTSREYLSTHHLYAAQMFAKMAEEIENSSETVGGFNRSHRSYVLSAVVLAACFMEAAINELLVDAQHGYAIYIKPLGNDVIGTLKDLCLTSKEIGVPVLCRYQKVLEVADRDPFNKGTKPYQDADGLVKLRNEFVHWTPKTQNEKNDHWTVKRFKRVKAFPPNALLAGKGNDYFPDHCLGAGCARWAIESALALTEEFFDRVDISPNYRRILDDTQRFEKT